MNKKLSFTFYVFRSIFFYDATQKLQTFQSAKDVFLYIMLNRFTNHCNKLHFPEINYKFSAKK